MRGMAASLKLIALAALTAALMALFWVAPAGAHELVEFESKAALGANGPIPPIPTKPEEQVKEVCGSETAVFGSELLTGVPPSEIKVKDEWGDVVPGKDMMVSGTITNVELSGGDLSFDHPFSRDYTFDVLLDEPYWTLSRELGPGASEGAGEHELHMELEVGQLPHTLPQLKGPAEGAEWLTVDAQAHENLQAAFEPQAGERIAMRGRWIIDCGHNDFHTELHPITFMAFGHAVGSKTVVHVVSNPYRVTELYGFGTAGVNSAPKGTHFPQALEETIGALTKKSIEGKQAAITLQTGIERTQPSTVKWLACKPTVGKPPILHQNFVYRKGVKVSVKPIASTKQCAEATITVGGNKAGEFGSYTALQPPSRACGLPYAVANAEVGGGLGVTGIKVNEIERITTNASAGTFTISHGGEETTPLAFNAFPAQVQSALEGLASIGPGNVSVKFGAAPGPEGDTYIVEFKGSLKEMPITPLTTDHSKLVPDKKGRFLATVVVLRPGGELDLERFILSLIEQRVKAELEFAEEYGSLVGAIGRIEENVANTPQVACLDPLSAPVPDPKKALAENNTQPFPYYGEVVVE